VSGGISTYRILRGYQSLGRPIRRADGRWMVRDICAASSAIALGHALTGIEDYADPERRVRVVWVFEADDTFEADYNRFEIGEPIPIRKFLDSFFALQHISRTRPRHQRNGASAPVRETQDLEGESP
jgi:hypothetical protein